MTYTPVTTRHSLTQVPLFCQLAKCRPGNTQNGGTVLPTANLTADNCPSRSRVISEQTYIHRPTQRQTHEHSRQTRFSVDRVWKIRLRVTEIPHVSHCQLRLSQPRTCAINKLSSHPSNHIGQTQGIYALLLRLYGPRSY